MIGGSLGLSREINMGMSRTHLGFGHVMVKVLPPPVPSLVQAIRECAGKRDQS
jgi:hypothetical protein